MKHYIALAGLAALTTACHGTSSVSSASDVNPRDDTDESADADAAGVIVTTVEFDTEVDAKSETVGGSSDSSTSDNSPLMIDEEVLFAYDSAKLRPEGKEKLDEITSDLEGDDAWASLTIAGHADVRGPDAYNMDLSRQRAKSVRSYLESEGLPGDKIDLKAYGEERPAIASADTDAEHRQNRRVEFTVVR